MTTLKTLILWLLIVFIFTGLGIAIGWAWRDMRAEPIPTKIELQQALIARGHDLEADGIIGPLTDRAWDWEICQRYALRSYAKMPKENKQ